MRYFIIVAGLLLSTSSVDACMIRKMVSTDPCIMSSYAAKTDYRISLWYNKNKLREGNKWPTTNQK